MRSKSIYLIFMALLLLRPLTSFSQQLTGAVFEINNSKEMPLAGVNVYWSNTINGTITDGNGKFTLTISPALPSKLVFSFIGYEKDTILISDLKPVKMILKNTINLKEITI